MRVRFPSVAPPTLYLEYMKHRNILKLEDGYYHTTEDEDLVGPFKSPELAQIAYDAYVKWVNHDHQENHYFKMRDCYD